MKAPASFILGRSDVPSVALTLVKLAPVQRVVDMFALQNYARERVGEFGVCTGGFWEGWAKPVAGGIEINVVAYRAYVRALPAGVQWLDLDLEGDFPYPDERTIRGLRLLHAIALGERPEIYVSCFVNAAMLPYEFGGDVARFKRNVDRLGYGVSDAGAKIATRGLFRANHCVAAQYYPPSEVTFDEIDRVIASLAETIIPLCNAGQQPGLWITPIDYTRKLADDRDVNAALPIRTMAHLGGCARRRGIKVLNVFGYQSALADGTDQATVDRETWQPRTEAATEAFL